MYLRGAPPVFIKGGYLMGMDIITDFDKHEDDPKFEDE